ncbi:MAG: ATP-binding protein [Gemmatimonadota bacterium]|nr:MAG: ATP-binding protein [Gemmatimonadota bacterium]
MPSKEDDRNKELTIPSSLKWMPRVVTEIEKVVRDMGFDEETGDFLAIAVTEAVNNAIIHGNKGDARKKVHIRFEPRKDRIVMRITDEGGGFNPEKVEDPTDPKNISKGSGRGLYILRTLMDKVDISSTSSGTTITLTKFK